VAGRSGQLSREQREKEGERADGRARGVSGRGGVESERAASAQVGQAGVHEGGEKEESGPQGKGAGPRGRGEAGRAGLADCLLQISFLFLFYSF
jgi:hypothetical protein